MALTLADVARIAHLARLELDATEAEVVHAKLQSIFALIDALDTADTSGVEPMAHAQDLSQRLRADKVTETDRRESYQAVAPEVEDGLYLVPQVIE